MVTGSSLHMPRAMFDGKLIIIEMIERRKENKRKKNLDCRVSRSLIEKSRRFNKTNSCFWDDSISKGTCFFF